MKIEKNARAHKTGGDGELTLSISAPKLEFEQTRWANLRNENVTKIADIWNKNPNLVKVISDPKLSENELVILSKANFETLYKMVKDLESGQAGLSFDVDLLSNQLTLVYDLVTQGDTQEKKSNPVIGQIKKAVEVAVQIVTKSKAKLFIVRNTKPHQSAPLTIEEQAELDYEDE